MDKQYTCEIARADTVSHLIYSLKVSVAYDSESSDFTSYFKHISWICTIIGFMVWANTVSDLIISVGQFDLYFMVK